MTSCIQPVDSSLLPDLLALNEAAVPNVNSVALPVFERFARAAAYFRIAHVDDVLAGFLIALTPDTDYDSPNFQWFKKTYPSFVYVDRIVVAESARRRGVGAAFYRDLEAFALPFTGLMTCEVNVRPANPGSLRFHERFGFERVGEQDTEGGAKRVVLMAKRIGTT